MPIITKPLLLCFALLLLLATLTSTRVASAEEEPPFSQQRLEQLLAPVALYPDTLLSHILIAATYPLEVVQLARWRAENDHLDQQQALDAVEEKDWDPSVKTLAPFSDLLHTMSEDLEWLESLGNAFLEDESRVLATVQNLRKKASDHGTLTDNDYIEVDRQDDDIIVIQPVEKEVVYVPYYDTRVVYGPWWHPRYPPHYWHHPPHYAWDSGFYWSTSFFIGTGFYFSSFHWRDRHLLVDYNWRKHHRHAHRISYRDSNRHSANRITIRHNFNHWRHNPVHRHGVRYPRALRERDYYHKRVSYRKGHDLQPHHVYIKKYDARHDRRDHDKHRNKHSDRNLRDTIHDPKNYSDRQHDGQTRLFKGRREDSARHRSSEGKSDKDARHLKGERHQLDRRRSNERRKDSESRHFRGERKNRESGSLNQHRHKREVRSAKERLQHNEKQSLNRARLANEARNPDVSRQSRQPGKSRQESAARGKSAPAGHMKEARHSKGVKKFRRAQQAGKKLKPNGRAVMLNTSARGKSQKSQAQRQQKRNERFQSAQRPQR